MTRRQPRTGSIVAVRSVFHASRLEAASTQAAYAAVVPVWRRDARLAGARQTATQAAPMPRRRSR